MISIIKTVGIFCDRDFMHHRHGYHYAKLIADHYCYYYLFITAIVSDTFIETEINSHSQPASSLARLTMFVPTNI